ncbi:MAG: dihydrolipoyllysine-residue acetyltransferase [Lysobacteraceae bacterium]
MTQVREAHVPDIGGHSDVPVIELLVAEGDRVEKDQGLVTLESDKATMEVPAPFAGTVKSLKVKVGDAVSEGALVALIEVAADGDSAGGGGDADGGDGEKAAGSAPDPAPSKQSSDSSERPAEKPDEPAATASGVTAEGPRTPPVRFDADALMPDKVPYASPAVRVFARELGVDLVRVAGSARKGRITREDVQAHVKSIMQGGGRASGAAGGGGGLDLIPWPKVDFAKFGEVRTEPLSRIKKLSGANLARNWAMIPHVTQHELADITEMEAFRKQLGAENTDVKVTPLVFLIKAAVAALKKYPQFNASLDQGGENLVLKQYVHIGIAVDTPDGLVVPVIRDCDRKGLLELAAELGAISKKAREKKLGPADMQGGCFSISSLGGIGGTAFTPIINAPEVAILGVSRSSIQPVWDGKAFQPRLMLPLSLSYDHRVIDGAAAARFTGYLAQVLGDLRRVLL